MRRYFILAVLLLLPGLLQAQHTRAYGHGGSVIVTSDTVNIDKTNYYLYYYTTDSNWYLSGGGILKEVTLMSTSTGTITATVAQFDTIEGLNSDSVFVNDDLVLLQNILFKSVSGNVASYWLDASGDTCVTIDSSNIIVTSEGPPYFVITDRDSNRNVSTLAEATDSTAVYAYLDTDGDAHLHLMDADGDFLKIWKDNAGNAFIDATSNMVLQYNGDTRMIINGSYINAYRNFNSAVSGSYSLGVSGSEWNNLYLDNIIYCGGKGEDATIYWSKENTIAGSDSSGKLSFDAAGNPTISLKQAGSYNQRIGYALEGWVTHDAATDTVTIGVLPANAIVTNVNLWTQEAFDADGTDEVCVGYSGTAEAYAVDVDVSDTGVESWSVGSVAKTVDGTARTVQVYYHSSDATNLANGECHVIVEFFIATVNP